MVGEANRKGAKFKEDSSESALFRQQISWYVSSGFDRGHLIPAADMKGTQKTMDDTFVLSNVIPQDPALNRGFWSKTLERFVRDLTNVFDEVSTGVFRTRLFASKPNGGRRSMSLLARYTSQNTIKRAANGGQTTGI